MALTADKIQPSQIKAVNAVAAQDIAETTAFDIANDLNIYKAYKELLNDMAVVLNKQMKMELRQTAQDNEITAVRLENEELRSEVKVATERAERAELLVVNLKGQVEDYPKRVIALEDVINEQREEIKRLHGIADTNADARKMEAETASTLANTAAAQITSASGETTPADEQSSTADKAIKSVSAAIDEIEK